MKRTVCVILALLLCVGMLAGCGGSSGAAKTEEPAAAAPADAGPVEVNVTVWGPQEDQSDDNG